MTILAVRPTPTLIARRVVAQFQVERRNVLGDWHPLPGAAGTRLLPPGQAALDMLVLALVREYRQNKLEIRVSAASTDGDRVLIAYQYGSPRQGRTQ
jgi:hypothetical protein